MPGATPDFQRRIIDEFIALTPGEAAAHSLFSHLARATNDELQKLGSYRTLFLFSPDSAGFGSAHIKAVGAKVSEELVQGWKRFADLYQGLIARNPRLELRDLMQDISERMDSASWPDGREWDIERWICDGAPEGQMRYCRVDDDIRDRLLELYPILGGWLYLDETGMVVFAETAVFRQVKVRMDAEREERIRQERERVADIQRQVELRQNEPGIRLVSIGPRRDTDIDPERS
jgi:hypothetical protein